MSETLKNRIDNSSFSRLFTPNIQVFEKRLSDEKIKFANNKMTYLYFSTFKNSDLINMEFIHVNFDSSYFKKCIFENTSFQEAEFDNCVFNDCNLSESDVR